MRIKVKTAYLWAFFIAAWISLTAWGLQSTILKDDTVTVQARAEFIHTGADSGKYPQLKTTVVFRGPFGEKITKTYEPYDAYHIRVGEYYDLTQKIPETNWGVVLWIATVGSCILLFVGAIMLVIDVFLYLWENLPRHLAKIGIDLVD